MSERAERLRVSWESRTSDSLQKARSAINQLIASEEEVTFAAVHKTSGVSKNFLYNNEEIRKEIIHRADPRNDPDLFWFHRSIRECQ